MESSSDETSSDVQVQRIRSISEVLKSTIKWGFLALIAFFGLEAIRALAGDFTFATVDVSTELGLEIGFGDVLWGVFILITASWALLERNWRSKLSTAEN